ncbi:MAG: hypothetical protein KBS86_01735 [Proteobacteria bacterium]|nr:hypothetical protein [Candidatus Enterousia scatequi]
MKNKIFILSALIGLCGVAPAVASDCIDDECNIGPLYKTAEIDGFEFEVPVNDTRYAESDYNAKLLTIKPVAVDNHAKLWDGTRGEFRPGNYIKTVSWRDGAPIWDDSISNPEQTDFSDWFLEPLDEYYISEDNTLIDVYRENMANAAVTRARVDEILSPKKPMNNIWTTSGDYSAQDMSEVIQETFGQTDGCPFDTDSECEIWRKKPMYSESVAPHSPKMANEKIDAFIDAISCDPDIRANDDVSAPMLARYKMLMQSANACCTDGFVYKLKSAGAADDLIYKFMADDANFYGFGARCLMMTDAELDEQYPNTSTAVVAADVRNGCLCRGRQWFKAMLAPFVTAYNASSEFKNAKFYYTYTDGLQRQVKVSVNNDVQNVLKQLEMCP